MLFNFCLQLNFKLLRIEFRSKALDRNFALHNFRLKHFAMKSGLKPVALYCSVMMKMFPLFLRPTTV